jgi:hypothetical protein
MIAEINIALASPGVRVASYCKDCSLGAHRTRRHRLAGISLPSYVLSQQ